MPNLAKCPGLYCGRMPIILPLDESPPASNDTISPAIGASWTECGACPRGYRIDPTDGAFSECHRCLNDPTTYDWMYLGFMAVVPLVLHWFSIDVSARNAQFTRAHLLLHGCAAVEVCLAAVLTLLVFEPMGSLHFHTCGVHRLADWYTLFHNPTPNYEAKLHCSQEAVFPLQTMVLVFYLLCIVLMTVRPWLNRALLKEAKAAVYSALYFLPVLALLHTVAGGLVYYAFPYLSIVLSMVSNAAHYSLKTNQDMRTLLKSSVTEAKNVIIILGHWLLLAYGILTLPHHLALLVVVPLPALFYIVTVKFTDPGEPYNPDADN